MSKLQDNFGANHIYSVTPPLQFTCYFCGEVVSEPEDVGEAVAMTNHPESVVCMDCEWRQQGGLY